MTFYKEKLFSKKNKTHRGLRANERIRSLQVQVINSDGKNLGTLTTREAIDIARARRFRFN